jgi:formiminoglutamate deiminase
VTTFWCEHAWLGAGDGPVADVRVLVDGGRITAVQRGFAPLPGDVRLTGVVLPGLANAHSHAFHRALRGRTHDEGGTFWTWRERMYALASRLDPESYLALARAAYAEMALAGVTCVGEFHYLHHGPGGRRYADPNAMGEALVSAAAEAGIRLTLLDTCYLAGGLVAGEGSSPGGAYQPLDAVQQRFSDGDVTAWAARVSSLPPRRGLVVGAAVHSVRAGPAGDLRTVAAAAHGRPLHVHLSEQPAENDACRAVHGCSPTELLGEHGLLGPTTTAVHATHLSGGDVELLGGTRTSVCACPSTEADLADGIGPFRRLLDAGSPLCLGSDQHASVDLVAEARAVELTARLSGGQRGVFAQPELLAAATAAGHRSLGWDDAGLISVGARADLVAVALDTPRTAGTAPGQVLMSASAADVRTVVVDGRVVVRDGQHVLGDVGRMLTEAIDPLWEE